MVRDAPIDVAPDTRYYTKYRCLSSAGTLSKICQTLKLTGSVMYVAFITAANCPVRYRRGPLLWTIL
jgi:hypothetical protein